MANNNNTKNLNVPTLRFPEFTGEWEETIFEKVCNITTGNKNTQDKEEDGEYPFYVRSEIVERINSYSFNGEAILTAGDGVGVGKVFHYVNGKVGVHQRVYILSDFECSCKFAYYYFSGKFYNRVKRMSAKNSVDSVRRDMIAQMPILLPVRCEQNKIATFLSFLDRRIEIQGKIIERFESLIKGLSESLFSQRRRFMTNSGNNFPNWEIVKLREVMSIPEKKKPAIIDKNKLLTVKLHMKGVSENDNTETLSLGATNYFSRKKGQFIYGKQNLFNGAFGLIPDKLDGFLSSSDVPTLDINHKKLNGTFLVCYFSRESFYKKLEGLASGSGSKRIHETTLLDIKIHLPSLEEQAQIANFLSVINKKLETEKLILGNYIKQKRYLLNQMFT